MRAFGGVWCTGIGNESRVTCMRNYEWWLCHKYDVNYMIMQSNMTMMNISRGLDAPAKFAPTLNVRKGNARYRRG